MTWARFFRRALGAASVVLAVGCSPPLPPLEEVATPDLRSVEQSVVRQLEQAHDAVDVAARRGDLQRVADAYGSLGEIYHAYGLAAPAAAAYRNAQVLDPGGFAWPYYQGLLAQDAGDFAAARRHYERALELRSSSIPARWRLGEVLLATGEGTAADEHFALIADDREAAAVAAFGRGRAAMTAGDFETAADHLQKARRLAPSSGAVAHALGQALRRLGREAEQEVAARGSAPPTVPDPLAKRIEELATSGGSLLRRGGQALVAGRLDSAEQLFRRGVETDPDNIELRLNLATTLVRANRLDEAAVVLRAAIDRSPEDAPARARAHLDLGTVLRARGDAEEAVLELQKASELQPDLVEAHFNLANALGELGRWPEVASAASRVVELDPDHARARYLVAMAGFRQGRRDQAEAELRQLVEQQPAEPAFREGLATVLAETRRTAAAAAVLRAAELRAAGASPSGLDEQTRLRLLRFGGPLLWRFGDRRTAITLWRECVELEPSSRSLTDLANGLQLSNQRQEALQLFARAVELDPENSAAWLAEASLLILDGQLHTADQRLRAALAVHPQHPGLAGTLARLLATAPDPELRDGRLAVELARLAYGVELSIEHGETLAMALAEFGNFEQAIGVQRRLAQQAQIAGDRATLRRLVGNLKRYEQRLPVRVAAGGN